jgi:Tetratricopeptide repeat
MPEEAVMTLEEGLKIHPAYMSARVLLGKAHLMLGEMDKACEQFENVIKAVPDNLFALRKLGEIYLAQAKRDEALKNFRILAILSPKDEELNSIISQLEAGNLPPSPLEMPVQKETGDLAEEASGQQTAAVAPAEASPEAVTGMDEALTEPEASEDEELEGSAPVYEIEDEPEEAGVGLEETEMQGGAEEGGGGLGDDVPLPEKQEPSPFEIGEDVPFAASEPEALGFGEPGPAHASVEDEGIFDLGSDKDTGEVAESVHASSGPGEGAGLDDIFASYGKGEEAVTDTEAAEQGVYELEEPSDLDLEELGVKMQSPSPHTEQSLDMAFDVEGEPETPMPSGEVFGLETHDDEDGGLFFEEEPLTEEPAHEEAPFEVDNEAEVSPFEEAFGHDEQFPASGGEDALPFDMAEDEGLGDEAEQGVEPFLDTDELSTSEEISHAGDEAVPGTTEAFVETPVLHEPEPIRTETLAEMYIRQGFYDRAIGIYKQMIIEAPGDMSLRQKLEELYMLAGFNSAKSATENVQVQTPAIEPADFVLEEGVATTAPELMETAPPVQAFPSSSSGDGGDVVERLERFLDNIRRRGRQ